MANLVTEDPSRSAGRQTDRVFLITGAAVGLGRAMLEGLLGHGYRGIAVDRNSDALEATASEIQGSGRLTTIVADLANPHDVDGVLAKAREAFGRIDILVNNAGLGPNQIRPNYFANPVNVDEISPQLLRQFFEVNAIAPMLLAIGLIPEMRKNRWGRIINVTTSLPSMLRRGLVPYGGTKASLEAHSAIMAKDLEGTGITVNVLVPGGPANTAMVPDELGFKRSALVQPSRMVPPFLWLVAESSVNAKRVVAGMWDEDAGNAAEHAAIRPLAWSLEGETTLMPEE